MQRILSLNCIPNRVGNLRYSIPILLPHCDIFHLNLIGTFTEEQKEQIPYKDELDITQVNQGGSELRFLHYGKYSEAYYFTLDDDILYPPDYVNTMIEQMQYYSNKAICCVHGSFIDFDLKKDFFKYKSNLHFTQPLKQNTQVLVPGVGTSCFYTKNFRISLDWFGTPNMSDAYITCFAYREQVPVCAISRVPRWLKQLPEQGSSIWGNNPHTEIDTLIRSTFSL